jgi:predicted amidophosphoribosyltransferase
MKKSQVEELVCDRCEQPVNPKDTFCNNCGGIYSDDLFCANHKSAHAEGVCVICGKPLCGKCGSDVLRTFLCDKHWALEITEGKVRVFGSTDNVQAQAVTSFLKQAGYHPFFFSRHFNPGADKVSVSTVRNFGNHPTVELKVLVPFSEYLSATKELKKHKFKEI